MLHKYKINSHMILFLYRIIIKLFSMICALAFIFYITLHLIKECEPFRKMKNCVIESAINVRNI